MDTGHVKSCLYPGPGRGTLIATFLSAVALTGRRSRIPVSLERAVFSCDYNGWADVPEEEREGVDAFEATRLPARAAVPAPLAIRASLLPALPIPQRRAA